MEQSMARTKADGVTTLAFSIPICAVEPAGAWETIRDAWREAAFLKNWCVQQLMRHDCVVPAGVGARIPECPVSVTDLYAMAFGREKARKPRSDARSPVVQPLIAAQYPRRWWWDTARASASSLIVSAYKKYADERLDVLCHGKQHRLTGYSARQPFPIPGANWEPLWAGHATGRRPVLEAFLPHEEYSLPYRSSPSSPVVHRVGIVLSGNGRDFGRQLAQFGRLVAGLKDGTAKKCEIRLVPGRRGNSGKGRGDDMATLVVQLPRVPTPGTRSALLATNPDCFWVAELDGRPAWVLNDDHLRRAVVAGQHRHRRYEERVRRHDEHLGQIQRVSQDAKMERRVVGSHPPEDMTESQRRNWKRRKHARQKGRLRKLEEMARKDRDRMDSLTHEMTAHFVAYCVRQRVGEVVYDDSVQTYCARFPWHMLRTKLEYKCKAAGIVFHHAETQQPSEGGDSE